MKERFLCFLLLGVQSLIHLPKARCSGQGNTGVNILMEKIYCIFLIYKQGSSVWMFQEGPDSVCILLLFNLKITIVWSQ